MSCNCNCGQCTDQEPCDSNTCSCPIEDFPTNCILYTGDDLECADIESPIGLNEVIKGLSTLICNRIDYVIALTTLVNLGNGAKVYKTNILSDVKELRTIISEDTTLLDVIENSQTIGIKAGQHSLEFDLTTLTQSLIIETLSGATTLSQVVLPSATTTQKGFIEIATQAEVDAGVDSEKAVVPSTLTTLLSDPLNLPSATTTQKGIIEIATDVETQTGTDNERAITPSSLSARTATEARTGILEVATQTEADALTVDDKIITPAKLPISSETQEGLTEIATQAEVDAGIDDQRYITPLKQKTFVDNSISTYVSNPTNLPNATESQRGIAEIATQAEVDAGIDDERFVTPAKLKTYIDNTSSLGIKTTTVNVSGWTKNSLNTGLVHGIGVEPLTCKINLVCISAANGYSVGDKVDVVGVSVDNTGGGTDDNGLGISWSGTNNFTLQISNLIWVKSLSAGGSININPADFDIEVVFFHT